MDCLEATAEKYQVDALPDRNLAKWIFHAHQTKLKNSFIKIMDNVNRAFSGQYSDVCLVIENLDLLRRFSPFTYYCYFKLLSSVKNQDVETAKVVLRQLENAYGEQYYQNSLEIGHIKTEFWEDDIINQYENSPIVGIDRSVKFRKITNAQLEKESNFVKESLQLISEFDPEFFAELSTYVTKVKLHAGDVIVGATAVNYFGCMFITIPSASTNETPLLYYCEHLIHEASHLHLHAILSQDRLVLNSNDEKYPAPIRPDLRPIYGIYHATFVLSRMVRFFKKLQGKHIREVGQQDVRNTYNSLRKKFDSGYSVIRKHGKLTKVGQKIFDTTKTCFI